MHALLMRYKQKKMSSSVEKYPLYPVYAQQFFWVEYSELVLAFFIIKIWEQKKAYISLSSCVNQSLSELSVWGLNKTILMEKISQFIRKWLIMRLLKIQRILPQFKGKYLILFETIRIYTERFLKNFGKLGYRKFLENYPKKYWKLS